MIPIERQSGPDELPPNPESVFAIEKQIESLMAGKKLAVLITLGTSPPPYPSLSNRGLKSVRTDRGYMIFDPNRITARKVSWRANNHTHYKILGHCEPKSALCDSVVVAMINGEEVQSSYCSSGNVATQASVFRRFYPDADVIYGGPEIEQALLLARRLKGNLTNEYS